MRNGRWSKSVQVQTGLTSIANTCRQGCDSLMKLVPTMRFGGLVLAAFVSNNRPGIVERHVVQQLVLVPIPDDAVPEIVAAQEQSSQADANLIRQPTDTLSEGIREWLVPSALAAETPSKKDIQLLNRAMAAYYNRENRDLDKAEELLSEAIVAWEKQPADERAALFRIRADCNLALMRPVEAQNDYSEAVKLLQTEEGEAADPGELPASYLGRARAIRSQGPSISKQMAEQAAMDYRTSLKLSSREDWDTEQENIEDGAARNPYAAWEWGSSLRSAGKYAEAAKAHALAAQAFKDIGDRARSVIALLDSGVDLAADNNVDEAKSVLSKAIKMTTSVEGRDVSLLQRVVAKEGEGRMALASMLWENNERVAAETQLSDACVRLEQLEADAQARNVANKETPQVATGLKYSIDDQASVFDMTCTKFRNEKFLEETVQWPASLREKMNRVINLGR